MHNGDYNDSDRRDSFRSGSEDDGDKDDGGIFITTSDYYSTYGIRRMPADTDVDACNRCICSAGSNAGRNNDCNSCGEI